MKLKKKVRSQKKNFIKHDFELYNDQSNNLLNHCFFNNYYVAHLLLNKDLSFDKHLANFIANEKIRVERINKSKIYKIHINDA